MRFLIIEDDKNISKIVRNALEEFGDTTVCFDGRSGLEELEVAEFDLVILDLMMPEMSGNRVLKELRKRKSTPVIILTAIDDVEEKLKCFAEGADDYLTKPFSKEELAARAKAVLRRHSGSREGLSYSIKKLLVDFERKTITYDGVNLNITGKKYELLEYLVMSKGKILSKSQIFNRVWGICSDTVYSVIDVYVSHLRKELDKIGFAGYIKTIANMGYIWVEDNV